VGKVGSLNRSFRSYPEKVAFTSNPLRDEENLFWAAVELGLKYEKWWLNDLATAAFFEAIRTHGHKIKVPPRSRQEFEKQRDAFKRGDPTAILLAPHLAYSGGLYESGVKGGSGCGDDDGGVTSTGFEKTLRECHRILHRTRAKITGIDWARFPAWLRMRPGVWSPTRKQKRRTRHLDNVDCRIWFVR